MHRSNGIYNIHGKCGVLFKARRDIGIVGCRPESPLKIKPFFFLRNERQLGKKDKSNAKKKHI